MSLAIQSDSSIREENIRLRVLLKFSCAITLERDTGAQIRMLCEQLRSATGCTGASVVLDSGVDYAVPDGFALIATIPLGDIGEAMLWDSQPRELTAVQREHAADIAGVAAIAIVNSRLYAESERELRRRDALRRVVASISSELDQDSLFGRVIAGAVELLESDSGVISLVDPDGRTHVRAVHNLPEWLVGRRLEPGEGLSGRVLQTRSATVVENYLRDIPRSLTDDEGVHVESGVAVPVWWKDHVIGVLGVLALDRSRVFTAQDREVMEVLASHVAIAFDNARLYGEVRDRLAEVTGLQAASTALAEELQPQRALRVLAEQALRLSSAATVSIELLGPAGTELEVQVAVGENAVELAAMRVAVEGSLAGAAVASGIPQVSRGQLVLPLRARGRTLGTLSAYTHDLASINPRQVELLATFASQAAISLDNAQLYGELSSRLEEMVGLQRLGTLLLEEHDFDRVLNSICRQLQRLTDAGGVGIALLEEDPRFLEMRTVVGPSADALLGARIPTDGSFAAEALRTNRPQRSNDAQNDPRGYKHSLVLGNTRTILSVPMKTRQRTVGVLSVYNKEGGADGEGFTDRDAELATFFANQAAAAIENARLYEQSREYAVIEERNRLARELHDSVTQSLFSVTLLSEAALNLLDRDVSKARERLERANDLAQGALAEMRALIFELRPMTLQEEGLLSALKKHLNALHSRYGRVVQFQVVGTARRLPSEVEDATFRIVQEGLNNVIKHAASQTATVVLEFAADCLRASTIDDGIGFDPTAPLGSGTFGMSTMRERAEAVGGRLTVDSTPGHGTTVTVEFPLRDVDQ